MSDFDGDQVVPFEINRVPLELFGDHYPIRNLAWSSGLCRARFNPRGSGVPISPERRMAIGPGIRYVGAVMAIEIERKFLVRDDSWRQASQRSAPIRQGYFCRTPLLQARIRIFGDKGYITLKSEPGTLTLTI
jgi:hypothetical protein